MLSIIYEQFSKKQIKLHHNIDILIYQLKARVDGIKFVRYLMNCPWNPVLGKDEMGGLNFTQIMMDWYKKDIKTEPKDGRYVHQAETISDAKLNHLKNNFFILSMSENELSNDWWNTNTMTANEKTDTSKDGIKKQETDALQLLKRQYDHALLSAIQNVQMQDAFSGISLSSPIASNFYGVRES